MSPEQARGDVAAIDVRADAYALGVILYELLGGRLPFDGNSKIELLVKLLDQDPIPLGALDRSCPRDLDTIVMRCLEKAPRDRYESALALAEDLGRFLEGKPISAREPINAVQ